MKKLWSHLFFLVLALSALSRGENDYENSTDATQMQSYTVPENDRMFYTTPVLSSQNPTSGNETDPISTAFDDRYNNENDTRQDANENEAAQTTANMPVSMKDVDESMVTTISAAATGTSSKPDTKEETQSSGGYVILVFIILVILILCIILYLLRRAAKTHSFDLQRPVSTSHLREPVGTFEPVHLDALGVSGYSNITEELSCISDQPAPHDRATADDLSPPKVVNGTMPQSQENGGNVTPAPKEEPDVNSLVISLSSNTSPSLGSDPVEKPSSPFSSTDLLFDATVEEQQNENNNNNPSVCSSDPFVDINLDDPGWCEQLFSPGAPPFASSFSPFSSS